MHTHTHTHEHDKYAPSMTLLWLYDKCNKRWREKKKTGQEAKILSLIPNFLHYMWVTRRVIKVRKALKIMMMGGCGFLTVTLNSTAGFKSGQCKSTASFFSHHYEIEDIKIEKNCIKCPI